MAVPRDNLLVPHEREANQLPISPHRPDGRVGLLLIDDLGDPASGYVLGQDREIRALESIALENVTVFSEVAFLPLDKDDHLVDANRDMGMASASTLPDDPDVCRR